MNIAALSQVLKTYGALGLLFLVGVYIILKGELTFRYPRRGRRIKRSTSQNKRS